MRTIEIEIAVANYFGYRQNIIVPNVSWGMDLHECDMLVLTVGGYLKEVEIKITKYDLIKDIEKKHKHFNNKIKEFYFAIPTNLLEFQNYIPERAGILEARKSEYENYLTKKKNIAYNCHLIRKAQINKMAKWVTDNDRFLLARLGTMRIWRLKEQLAELELPQ